VESTIRKKVWSKKWFSKITIDMDSTVRGGIGRVSEITTGCMATLDENLILHIPYISNSDPKSGATSIWADFVYKLNPAYQSLIPFMLTTYGINFFLKVYCNFILGTGRQSWQHLHFNLK
jgi:hypothetical protein